MKKILLTGASGFLGTRLIKFLENSQESQLSLVFRKNIVSTDIRHFCVGDIDNFTDFSSALLNKMSSFIPQRAYISWVKNPVKQCLSFEW